VEIEGKIYQSGKFWLVEVSSLDAMTQGKNREDALFILIEATGED